MLKFSILPVLFPKMNISPKYTSHFRVPTDTRALNSIHFPVTNALLQANTECEYRFLDVQFKSRTRLQVKLLTGDMSTLFLHYLHHAAPQHEYL